MYKTISFVICCRFLVSVLEALVRTFNLTKLVLTVFDSNARENVIQEKNHIYGKLRKQVGGQPQFIFFYIFFFFSLFPIKKFEYWKGEEGKTKYGNFCKLGTFFFQLSSI